MSVRNGRRSVVLVLLSIAVTLYTPGSILAAGNDKEASQYSLGNQTLSVTAGAFLPLFLVGGSPYIGSTNLSLGGVGSIDWAAYVSPHIRVGAGISGTFAFDPNYTALLMIPLTVKVTYLLDFYPWEVPISLGTGINILKYSADSTIDFLLKPGTGLYWTYNSSWSFGLNLNYWWDMQFIKGTLNGGFSAGNFLEVSLSALYHY